MVKAYDLKKIEVIDGNVAMTHALRQAQVDVLPAYPITPSTKIVELFSQFCADGYIEGEFIKVESEHAAMSACVGASAAGARVATATASQGLAFMIEVLYQASGMRLPIVLCLSNRALAAPLNVNGDHSDMYLARDAGWIQLCSFEAQHSYDLTLMAFKIGENTDVRLPVVVNQDGFITSHTAENVHTIEDEKAHSFIGELEVVNSLLDNTKPITYGVQTEENWHFEHKARQHNDLLKSKTHIKKVFEEFNEKFGREYNIIEQHRVDDAEMVIVCIGSTYNTTSLVVDILRKKGIKVGVVSPRVIRPFPYEEFLEALKNVKAIACLDRSSPNGAVGMLYNEIAGALINNEKTPMISNYIYGLGGRDVTIALLTSVFDDLMANVKAGKLTHKVQQMLGLRGPKCEYFGEKG
jgi:pyruvate ferredoxin oxidoreductase alpha subunit